MGSESELSHEMTRKWQSACEEYGATWNCNLSNGEVAKKQAFANLMKVKTELDQLIEYGQGLREPFVVGIINPAQSR